MSKDSDRYVQYLSKLEVPRWIRQRDARRTKYKRKQEEMMKIRDGGYDGIKQEKHSAKQLEKHLVQTYLKKNKGVDNLYDNEQCEYETYLNSERWTKKKKYIIETYGGKCEVCDSTKTLIAHHNTYKNRGMEWDAELTILCKDCHHTYHFISPSGNLLKNQLQPKSQFNHGEYKRSNKPRFDASCYHCSLCSRESICEVDKEIRTLLLCKDCFKKFEPKIVGEVNYTRRYKLEQKYQSAFATKVKAKKPAGKAKNNIKIKKKSFNKNKLLPPKYKSWNKAKQLRFRRVMGLLD
jgi:hypothetical protein